MATTSSFAASMTLPGLVRSDVAAVTDVSVTPTHRRRGLLTAMMRRQLDDFRANGEAIAAALRERGGDLRPLRLRAGDLRRPLRGRQAPRPSLAPRARCPDERRRPDGSVRLVEQAQAAEAFPPSFTRLRADAGRRARSPAGEWAELLGRGRAAAAMGHRFYACYEQGGRIDGYAVYRVAGIDPADHWRRGVFLEELCSLSDVAYTALWRYLLGIDLTEELRT